MVNENLGQETRIALDHMIDELGKMPIGMPLLWLWVWDVMKYAYESYHPDSGEELVINPKFTIDDVWNELWERPVFSIDMGPEALSEHIFDWLREHNFIVDVEDLDVIESDEEEV